MRDEKGANTPIGSFILMCSIGEGEVSVEKRKAKGICCLHEEQQVRDLSEENTGVTIEERP